MTHKSLRPARRLLPLLLLLALPGPVAVADEEGTLNLYLKGSQQWFDSDRLDGTPFENFDLDDSSGGGVGFGFNITDRWALEGVVDGYSVDIDGLDEKVDLYNYHLDLFWQFAGQFCNDPCWQPYLAIGVGEIRIEYDRLIEPLPEIPPDFEGPILFDRSKEEHDRQTMANFGIGVKYRLGPRWQARADARAFYGVERGGVDGALSFTIGYQWMESPPIVRDTDADGFIDNVDMCPQTPPGVNVDNTGCPVDSDSDGIPDYLDLCAGTPFGTAVDEQGCPEELPER
ncbi:outer membrane beta-barrel protein [Microbulbifer yueqingensis]|uniref:OmpA-OmpF porin, OOP family n=1 Tax=Microbulbifer yueqingensis TaxID=658219 RepID=A0A1G9BHX0_9GAMM|nr:outer membrane beta-barrel protein [Microbulbifer yueqingensis]SDK39116.1 OmpA-OmpF porin, OOP family [Microbulbifer yueqingensis]